jgi:hypothetical protein
VACGTNQKCDWQLYLASGHRKRLVTTTVASRVLPTAAVQGSSRCANRISSTRPGAYIAAMTPEAEKASAVKRNANAF